MSPFRLFGPAPSAAAADPEPAEVAWAPGPWTSGAADGERSTATRHARPVAFGRGPGPAGVDDDPLTDPHGFPPVPASPLPPPPLSAAPLSAPPLSAPPLSAAPPSMRSVPSPPDVPGDRPAAWSARPVTPPDPLEAAALAGAFAADYLSWDEDDPGRRGLALADHLAPIADPALLGWDGRGRQRAEFALPGLVRADGDDRVLVDVRVRVTPYREVGEPGDRAADRLADAPENAEPGPEVPGVPAAAPAPTGRGWRGCASYWVRLSVPVVREDGRLVVDAADEATELTGDPGPGNHDRDDHDRDDHDSLGDGGRVGQRTDATAARARPDRPGPGERLLPPAARTPESAW